MISVSYTHLDVYKRQVVDITDSPCYLCARMRRGYLYSKARELGCNKIALGHHVDDVIETIVMGMLYGAQIQTMMPKLHSTMTCIAFSVRVVLPKGVHPVEEQKKGQREQM